MMPDQELFSIIHPGPPKIKYDKSKSTLAAPQNLYLADAARNRLPASEPLLTRAGDFVCDLHGLGRLALLRIGHHAIPDHRAGDLEGQSPRRTLRVRPSGRHDDAGNYWTNSTTSKKRSSERIRKHQKRKCLRVNSQFTGVSRNEF